MRTTDPGVVNAGNFEMPFGLRAGETLVNITSTTKGLLYLAGVLRRGRVYGTTKAALEVWLGQEEMQERLGRAAEDGRHGQ